MSEEKNNQTSNSQPLNSGTSELMPEASTESNAIQIPQISLPKGGGALKGIDEKFEVNAGSGDVRLSLPLPLSEGRNKFSPNLELGYNSSGGNSPFGLGWQLSVPSIRRKTESGLPRYRDDEDTFILGGTEDLVPYLKKNASDEWEREEKTTDDGYTVKRYRPRVEENFARIEQISHADHGTYWKVTSGTNVVTIYGRDTSARITNPEDSTQIFQWLAEFSYDDKGNWIKYDYKAEDLENVPNVLHESHRHNGNAKMTNQYLKRVKYGNQKAYYPDSELPYDPEDPTLTPGSEDEKHFFELVFDFGEHHEDTPGLSEEEDQKWTYRPDAFSFYRSGFEIRTNRLCQRVLMFHLFDELDTPYLVKSLEFEFTPSNINNSGQSEVSYLTTATQYGFVRKEDESYARKALPPVTYDYQTLEWNKSVQNVDAESSADAPSGLTDNYQWADLYNEGISGILSEKEEGWYYKENLGAADNDELQFSRAKQIAKRPSFSGLDSGSITLQDLEANGEKQLVYNTDEIRGFFPIETDEHSVIDIDQFTAFKSIPNIDWNDPHIRFIDLNGDGQPELVLSNESAFIWYPNLGKEGMDEAEFAKKAFDEEQGPAVIFADKEQSLFLADFTGDGLTDIVRIRNGEVCYWPNKGFGSFGAKVVMSNSPVFDHPDQYNADHIHIADVSGTGANDIIYLGKNKFKAFINHTGNSWSDAHEIDPFVEVSNFGKLSVIDFLGTGTSCIVWSTGLPDRISMRYIDLMNSRKPHVLVGYQNNMGKEVTFEYKSSTHFYLKDKKEGTPWITKLPFPVQVVSKAIIEEKITNVRFTTEYSYHHGYYDSQEREFRGFGRVEQLDSEYYAEWSRNNETSLLEKSEELYQKPVLTKTWFHTGAFIDRERTLNQFKKEYWYELYNETFTDDPISVTEPQLDDINLADEVAALSGDEFRESIRACKGTVLRQEVFALDAPESATDEELKLQAKPYLVALRNCNLSLVQPGHENKHGVFLATESEMFNIHYERDETDYRLTQVLNVAIDGHGNILESVKVVYGRDEAKTNAEFQTLLDSVTDFSEDVSAGDVASMTALQSAFSANISSAKDAQKSTHIIFTQNTYAKYSEDGSDYDDLDLPHAYRLRVPHEIKTFEITGKSPSGDVFTVSEFEDTLSTATALDYHESPGVGESKRLIEHLKTRYLDNNLNALSFGYFDAIGLEYENYQLAFTPGLVSDIYKDQGGTELEVSGDAVSDIIESDGNYTAIDGNLWVHSGKTKYSESGAEPVANVKQRFYAPISFEDPMGGTLTAKYDTETYTGTTRNNDGYYLFIRETTDALDNKMQVGEYNYRTQSPSRIIDSNANPTSVLYNELGQVKAIALEGNGVYADASETTVSILTSADSLSGLKAYEEEAETTEIDDYFGAATSSSTNTTQLLDAGNELLQQASIRFVYDLEAYQNTGDPIVVSTIVREEHYADNEESDLKFKFEFSNGLNNVVMAKEQAEPGNAYYMDEGVREEKDTGSDLRWIGNGRTVLNNKGKEVKQFEPYFSTNFLFEDASELVEIGVTSINYYDSIGRLIKTRFPDGSLTRIEFDSWKQLNFDRNDTVLDDDCDWYKRRTDATHDEYINDPKEFSAATDAAVHANTPTRIYIDSLGRSGFTILDNGEDASLKNRFYTTLVALDIEDNPVSVTDARGNLVMEHKYNMLGHKVYQNGMDAGERWILNNVLEEPVYKWDSRDHIFTFTYDALNRPETFKVEGGDGATPLNHIFERFVYGEGQTDDIENNLRTQPYSHYDMAGKLQNNAFDIKENLLTGTRQFNSDYKNLPNWIPANLNNPSVFDADLTTYTTSNEFNALGQLQKLTTADASETRPTFNETGLLETVSVEQSDAANRLFVKNIDYDAKGQRQKIVYSNEDGHNLATTTYTYDEESFRLKHLETKKSNGDLLQDLYFTYDPVGNITEVEDKAIPKQFFNNQKIEGKGVYKYDAINRLISAEGREHAGQAVAFAQCDNWNDSVFSKSYSPVDNMSWRNYTQTYAYDPVGNILKMAHVALSGNWTRLYTYQTTNNQLLQTQVGGQTYNYTHHAKHGYLTSLPHLQVMEWNFRDELSAVATQKTCSGNDVEITYYVYNADGERVRKVTETSAGGSKKEERLYLEGVEIYKKYSGADSGLQRTTLHVTDDLHRIAMIDTRNEYNDGTDEKTIRFQFSNHIDSANLELNDAAEVINYEEYHPYGTTAYSATNKDIQAAAKRYRYTGMERDEESGLGYHSARYYISWLTRWVSSDPDGLVDTTNLYQYSRSNPVKNFDKTGTVTDEELLARSGHLAPPPPTTPPPPPPPPPLWTDSSGNELTESQLENVRVFIFHDDDFSEQALVQYNDMVRLYGEGSVALSNTRSTARFSEAWRNMRGTNIARVMIMSHGKNQSINIGGSPPQQFTATGDGRTNISRSAAPNVQDLPQPIGNITGATLYMYTCHSADTQATAHGSGDHAQGPLLGTQQPIAEVFSRTFNFRSVVGTENAVNYYSFFTTGTPSVSPGYMQPYPEDGVWVTYRNGVRSTYQHVPPTGLIQSLIDDATQGTPLNRYHNPSQLGRDYDILQWLENGLMYGSPR